MRILQVWKFLIVPVFHAQNHSAALSGYALRKAAVENGKNFTVRFLASYWKHTDKSMLRFLKSLQDLNGRRGSLRVNVEVVNASKQNAIVIVILLTR